MGMWSTVKLSKVNISISEAAKARLFSDMRWKHTR